MANEHLKRMKELAGMVDNKPTTQQKVKRNPKDIVSSVHAADNAIDRITEQFNAPITEGKDAYSAKNEVELLNKIRNGEVEGNFEGRNIPRAILESIKSDPLILDTTMSEFDDSPRMKALTERLSMTNGVDRMRNIQQTLETADKQKKEITEVLEPKTSGTTVDYSMIKMIIENVLDEKLSKLNESYNGNNGNKLTCMTIKNDNFMFLTENGDVYECTMTYKGKNKKR